MDTKNKQYCCNNLTSDTEFISYIHKWKEYGGYSKREYPRFFCSKECLTEFEKNYKCNFCGMICYEWRNYKKGQDGFTYCDNINDISIGNTTCYNQFTLLLNK